MTDARPNAVIIGHGPGLGAAVARAFGREGMSVALIARNEARLAEAVAALGSEGIAAGAFAADCGDAAALGAALAAAQARFGNPDVLVYNAVVSRPGPVLATEPSDMAADLAVDITGALVAARAVVPAMRERGRGSLLFTGGGYALFPSPTRPSLSIGKAGLRALAMMLAQELAPAGIRVGTVTIMGTVAPGTKFDPDRIADAFLSLHRSAPDSGTAEIRFA